MPVNFNDIFETLQNEVIALAKNTVADFVDDATKDGLNILAEMKADLQTWSGQLAGGQMSLADFEFLVNGQKDVLELVALKRIGIAQVQLDAFKNGVFDLIIGTVSKLV